MKKLFTLCIIFLVIKTFAQPCNFTITPQAGTYSITCSNPAVNIQAINSYTGGVISYTWAGPSFTANTNTVTLTGAGNYTVTGAGAGCTTSSQTFAVVINTTAPTSSVTPLSQVINCSGASPVTFTGTIFNPTVNMRQDWYSPLNPLPMGVPIATSNLSVSILAGVLSPGVYTVQATDLANGCKTRNTVTITSLDAWPTFGVSSTTNFSIGCSPLNNTTLSIINPVSTQTPQGTCSYTFLPPGFAGTLAAGPFAQNTSTVTAFPGTWTLIVNDNSNSCQTTLWVPITQNTVAPDVSATMLTQTLTCFNPTVLATGSSTTANTIVSWLKPTAPAASPVDTLLIGPPTGPPIDPTILTYANYTVVATNTVNACVNTTIITINQNFKPPVSSPTISFGGPNGICSENAVVLTTGNSHVTSGGQNAFLTNPCWAGPAPQTTLCGSSSYSCYVPGIYSLNVTDSYNGCSSTGTVNVISHNPTFYLQGTAPTGTANCDGSVIINPIGQSGGYTVSVNMGTLTGSPSNTISNLCYGQLIVCVTYTSSGCMACDTLAINATTNIKKNNGDEDYFTIYPNPANSAFYIKNNSQKSGTIRIFNIEGKEIDASTGSAVMATNSIIKIENLKAGIYFIELRVDNSVVRKKVVVLNN